MIGSQPFFALRSVIQFVFGLVLVLPVTVICAQEPTTEFSDGPIQVRSKAIGNLVQMKLKGKMLALKRDWGKQVDNDEKEDHLDKEVDKLVQRGFDGQIADQIARRMLRGRTEFQHPITREFDKLKGERMSGSSGRSVTNGRISSYFSNRVMGAKIEVDQSKIHLTIKENEDPEREIAVRDDNNGVFSVRYSGENFNVELKQKSDGSIRILRVRGDEAEVFQAESYVALRKKNPKLVNEWLIPLFQHIGFSIPIASDDESVQRAVLNKLTGMLSRSMQDFNELVKDLDADEFQKREAASEKLTAQARLWQDAIQQALQSSDLSAEARARLNMLTDVKVKNPIDEIILAQDLLNSPEYLISLFDIATETESSAIIKQLEHVTKHSAPDAKAWREWFQDQ